LVIARPRIRCETGAFLRQLQKCSSHFLGDDITVVAANQQQSIVLECSTPNRLLAMRMGKLQDICSAELVRGLPP
jgi:hypothetical protein